MDYKVIINPELGGSEVGSTYNGINAKDYNLKFSRLLSEKLNSIGVSNILIRNEDKKISNEERIKYINQYASPSSIILSNGISNENGIEIIYALRDSDALASRLANNLEENAFPVNKYYQRRSEIDTTKDYEPIIRDTSNHSIIIRYGKLDANDEYLNSRLEDLVDVVANTLKSYLGLANDYYIVKKGDNLYTIAQKYNTTVDSIKKLNNLTSNNLSIGQRLIVKSIPSTLPDTNTYYTVKAGDTLYGIANKYGLTVSELKELNKLSSNVLSIGQRLIVNNNKTNNTYKVVNGDTLYAIARKYNTTVDELKRLNNLTTNNLKVNQILKIPTENVVQYVVKPGDTLYSIANKYRITVKDLMNLNNLKNNNLSINQKLIIPKSNIS